MSGDGDEMNPNSGNQTWSKWHFEVVPGRTKRPPYAEVRYNAMRFGRSRFGPTGAMRVDEVYRDGKLRYDIYARVEGLAVHDPQLVAFMRGQWASWAIRGFGIGTTCTLVEAKLEAGDRQDGSPRDQLIIFESPALEDTWTPVADAVKH